MRPLVRSATLNGYVALARSLDLDPAQLMREAGLDPADLAVPDKWVSAAAVSRLLDASAAESGRADFALRLAEQRRLSTLGPLSVVLREEPDLRSALTLLLRYEHSYNEALRMRLDESEEIATIRLWFEFGEPAPADQARALGVAALHGIIRECRRGRAGGRWRSASSTGPPRTCETLHRVFGPGLQFEHDFTGLVMYASDLDAANSLSDPLMRPYAQQFLASLVAPRARSASERVRELVELFLPLGKCSMDQVARALDMDRRTLHRHLAERRRVVQLDPLLHPRGARRAPSRERPVLHHRRRLPARLRGTQRLLPLVPASSSASARAPGAPPPAPRQDAPSSRRAARALCRRTRSRLPQSDERHHRRLCDLLVSRKAQAHAGSSHVSSTPSGRVSWSWRSRVIRTTGVPSSSPSATHLAPRSPCRRWLAPRAATIRGLSALGSGESVSTRCSAIAPRRSERPDSIRPPRAASAAKTAPSRSASTSSITPARRHQTSASAGVSRWSVRRNGRHAS